jgi:hypothetical protein
MLGGHIQPTDCFHSHRMQKLRALKALGRVLEGLTNKRFVIEPPRPSASGGPLGGPGMMGELRVDPLPRRSGIEQAMVVDADGGCVGCGIAVAACSSIFMCTHVASPALRDE